MLELARCLVTIIQPVCYSLLATIRTELATMLAVVVLKTLWVLDYKCMDADGTLWLKKCVYTPIWQQATKHCGPNKLGDLKAVTGHFWS